MAKTTVEANGYVFVTDEETGTVTTTGALQDKMASRKGMPKKAGGSLREAGDHNGHGVAARFNGPPIGANISAQNGKLNQGAFKRMENAEAAILKDGGKITTERIAYSSRKAADGSVRPDAYMVNDRVTYKEDGELQGEPKNIHLSFANLSPDEQAEMNAIVQAQDIPEQQSDELREQMTPQQYAELMQETDKSLPDIKGEYAQSEIPTPKTRASKKRGELKMSQNNKSAEEDVWAEKRAEFLASLQVKDDTVAKPTNEAGKKAVKPRADGGRERGDDGPGSLGRESGAYKGNTTGGKSGGGKGPIAGGPKGPTGGPKGPTAGGPKGPTGGPKGPTGPNSGPNGHGGHK